jgi:SRSO17 transposase
MKDPSSVPEPRPFRSAGDLPKNEGEDVVAPRLRTRGARTERPRFTATTLPANMSRRQLVRRVKQRWRTERACEDAKGELGLDHCEGRSFHG